MKHTTLQEIVVVAPPEDPNLDAFRDALGRVLHVLHVFDLAAWAFAVDDRGLSVLVTLRDSNDVVELARRCREFFKLNFDEPGPETGLTLRIRYWPYQA